MKKHLNIVPKLLFLSMILTLLISACQTIDPPTITIQELGYENSKTVRQGDELHVEAEILAEGKIRTVSVYIHLEDHNLTGNWEVDQLFTKFEGYKNTTFHEHFEVPSDAQTGIYHFQIEVVDQEGNVEAYEDEIEVLE